MCDPDTTILRKYDQLKISTSETLDESSYLV